MGARSEVLMMIKYLTDEVLVDSLLDNKLLASLAFGEGPRVRS